MLKFTIFKIPFQGRLTMKIAAMKMAKFGSTGLREVTTGVLPTRADHHSGTTGLSFGAFKRPRALPPKHSSSSSSSSHHNSETHKVKTAAERKTYADVLLPNSSHSRSSQKVRPKKVSTIKKFPVNISLFICLFMFYFFLILKFR